MQYAITLLAEGRELSIPVLPKAIKVKSNGKNEKATVLELWEVLILRQKALRSVEWESFFPLHQARYVTGPMISPVEAVQVIQTVRDQKRPIRLVVTGANLDINMQVGVDNFTYEERGGEPGDIYYSITLTEWKDYSPRRISLPATQNEPAVIEEPARPGEPEVAAEKTYAVRSGDSLWAIAQAHFGKGDKYLDLYTANQALIDARNRKAGASRYTIYPGQVLSIPK